MSRTPQKKMSIELQPKTTLENNSYLFPNNSAVEPQSSSFTSAKDMQMKWETPSKYQGGAHKKIVQHSEFGSPIVNNKMNLAKKYIQQELQLKIKSRQKQMEKQYREVVISDEFIRSHKLYKMLKQQISIYQARNIKQTQSIKQELQREQNQIKNIKIENHTKKIEMWQLKTKLLDLRNMFEQQQQENKKIIQEYQYGNDYNGGEQPEGEEGEIENGQFQQDEQNRQDMYDQQIENGKQQHQSQLKQLENMFQLTKTKYLQEIKYFEQNQDNQEKNKKIVENGSFGQQFEQRFDE